VSRARAQACAAPCRRVPVAGRADLQLGLQLGFVKTNGDGAAGPGDHRALDHAGLVLHQRLGAGGIRHPRLLGGVQLTPGGAFAVDQGFPAVLRQPLLQQLGADALFFEVVKLHSLVLGIEPGARLFDRGAVDDAVDGEGFGCRSHGRDDATSWREQGRALEKEMAGDPACCWCLWATMRAAMTQDFTTLQQWLDHCEQLHPVTIDMGLDRVRQVAQRMGLQLNCPVITVAGTNGKGSTCAMLEAILREAGYKTGVYTSPHLVHFEERLRLDGQAVDGAVLVPAFARVEAARLQGEPVSLTYFEFSTLAILSAMQHSAPDVVVLEVGLGGRLDAVNIIDTDCAIITSIDVDHTALLGKDRETIGREKAGIMRAGKPVVVSDPMPPASVLEHAQALGADLWRVGVDFNVSGDKQQWAWAGRGRRYSGLAYPALRGANQLVNAGGVLAALAALRDQLPITAQAVRNGFAFVDLPGRFQIVPGQPTLVLDVAHNPHAASALALNLDAMGFFPTTHAVFGVMADKDLDAVLAPMRPLIDVWYFTDLPIERASKAADVQAHWQAGNTRKDVTSSTYTDPQSALDAALKAAVPTDRIVVFGSFYTVGGVLQHGVPRLQAQHLPTS
jgi:dihydrofolate synthase/folylpolyglutamate synthase